MQSAGGLSNMAVVHLYAQWTRPESAWYLFVCVYAYSNYAALCVRAEILTFIYPHNAYDSGAGGRVVCVRALSERTHHHLAFCALASVAL